MKTIQRRTWLKDLFYLTILFGLIYSAFLGTRPLSPPDEGRYSEIPREMMLKSDFITPYLNGVKYFEKPILFYWLQSFSIKVFGLHEWSLRLISALMGISGCLLTYWCTRKLFGRRSALLASCILGTTLLYAGLANYIIPDMTLSVLLMASFFCFLLGTQSPPGPTRRHYMWFMYCFAALAVLTKGLIGIILPGMVIFTWLCVTGRWRELATFCPPSGTIIFLILTLPWHILVQLKNPEFFHFYFVEQHFLRYLTNYAARNQPVWFLPTILIIGFFPWTGFLLSALKRIRLFFQTPKHYEEIFLLLWASIIFLFYWASHSQLPPYILPIFAPLAMLTAKFVDDSLKENEKQLQFAFIFTLIFSFLLAIGLFIYAKHYFSSLLSLFGLLCIFPIISGTAFLCFVKRKFSLALLFITGISVYVIILFNCCFTRFDDRSIKPLAMDLNHLAHSSDIIYDFDQYNQDLPVYLNRLIRIVNWTGELTFGYHHQKTNILLHEKQLCKEWPFPPRRWLIAKARDLEYLKTNLALNFYVVDIKNNNALICNQEIKK
jgi:4-amino-4-deoxy-L-arabinose transferase-like glycosyltransferase